MKQIDCSIEGEDNYNFGLGLALTCIAGVQTLFQNIRLNRQNPGLDGELLTLLKCFRKLGLLEVRPSNPGCTEVEVTPGSINGGSITLHLDGSRKITPFLQHLLLPACFADNRVRIRLTGITDTDTCPGWDFLARIVLPFYTSVADVDARIIRRGFSPDGGGQVEVIVTPRIHRGDFKTPGAFFAALEGVTIEEKATGPARPVEIHGISFASRGLAKRRVAERMITGVRRAVAGAALSHPIKIQKEYSDSPSPGAGISIWPAFADGSRASLYAGSLGSVSKKAEEVGADAGQELVHLLQGKEPTNSCLPEMLIPILAVVGGRLVYATDTPRLRAGAELTSLVLGREMQLRDGSILCM